MGTFRFPRGPKSRVPLLKEGQAVWSEEQLIIGGSSGNVELAKKDDVNGLSSRVGLLESEITEKANQTYVEGISIQVGEKQISENDDTGRLQRAITKGMEKGVPVDLGNGVYYISSTLIGGSNLYLKGNGAKIDYSGIPKTYVNGVADKENPCLSIKGTTTTPTYAATLTADATSGSQSITVNNASQFVEGDWIQIISEDFYPYSGTFRIPRGEIKQIRSISGNTITFTTVIWEGYTLANSAKCRKLTLAENIQIEGIRFIGSDLDQLTYNAREIGIELYLCKNFNVERCGFYGQDFVGVRVRSSILGNVVRNDIKGAYRKSDLSKGTVYYGIAVQNNAQWVYVGQNKGATLRRLGVCTATQTDYGQAYHCIFQGNQFRDSHSGSTGRVEGFEHHGFGRWITFDANQTDSSLGGIRIEGRDVSVTNNIFTNCVGSGIVFDDDAGVFENILVANNHVTRAIEDGTSNVGYGIEIQLVPSDQNRNIIVRDNLIHGFASASRTGIRVIKNDLASSKNCHIIGNTIDSGKATPDTAGMGVFCEASGWDLSQNNIFGYDLAIRMSAECNGNIIDNNKVKNISTVPGSTNGAITVYGANVKSIRNIFQNCEVGHRAISSATNLKIHDNVYIGVTTPLNNAGTGTVETSAQVL
jgi:hypothetical protein